MPPGFEDYDSGDSEWQARLISYREAEAWVETNTRTLFQSLTWALPVAKDPQGILCVLRMWFGEIYG